MIESCGLPFKVSSAEVLPGGCIDTLGLSSVLRQRSVHWQSISGGIVPSVSARCDFIQEKQGNGLSIACCYWGY